MSLVLLKSMHDDSSKKAYLHAVNIFCLKWWKNHVNSYLLYPGFEIPIILVKDSQLKYGKCAILLPQYDPGTFQISNQYSEVG